MADHSEKNNGLEANSEPNNIACDTNNIQTRQSQIGLIPDTESKMRTATAINQSQEPTDLAFQISKLLIHWILGITAGFLFLTFALFFCPNLNDKKEYLDLVKILIPVITFLLGVISTLGFVNYKIPESLKK